MAMNDTDTVTRLLGELRGGRMEAVNELFPLVYEELRGIARDRRANWQGDYTLNTTALVHEAYLKLVDQTQVTLKSLAHFLAVASKAMRHLLIDYARRRNAVIHGGDANKVTFEEEEAPPVEDMSERRTQLLLVLDGALRRLEQSDPRRSRVVECRFFGQMTIKDTAAALDISRNTVKREWNQARLWLYREMSPSLSDFDETFLPE